jgi:hypothetical protein
MKIPAKVAWSLIIWCVVLASARPARAQAVTTGNITGSIIDQQSGALPGATVVAVHTLTGTTYQAVTQADGRFSILSVGVGLYSVKVTMSGFKEQEQRNVAVILGGEAEVAFKLQLATLTENVTVTAGLSGIDTTQAGAASNISLAVKESLPTISRSIIDIARTDSYFNVYPFGSDRSNSISIAGRNSRYNNMSIDGAVNNDIFGLSNSGTPEGQSGSQPISLDAIEQLQLVVSPYDVRQGSFTGGGVNAVTKSGANTLKGTAFYFGRNQDWVGKFVTSTNLSGKVSTFSDKQAGVSVGGPIVQNKAFYFFSSDSQRQETPSGVSVDSTGNLFGNRALVEEFVNTLKTQYSYDPGPNPFDEFTRHSKSDKVFVRTDFNLATGMRLTVRHNYVDSFSDAASGGNTGTQLFMPDSFHQFKIKTHSTVGQLNSTFGRAVNELRVSKMRVRNRRGGQPFEQRPFPVVTVTLVPGSTVRTGREVSSQQNQLDQDNIEVSDDFTWVRGNHTLTVGTHNEFFKFRNVFIQNNFGTYTFSSLANFQAGLAQAYTYRFSNTADPLQPALFSVRQFGAYVGDQWRAAKNLTITSGIRLDVPRFSDAPGPNAVVPANFPGYQTDIIPKVTQWSPRVGFNWALGDAGKSQVRGGVGMFAGRTPYVWLSNQYSNNGIDFTTVTITNNASNRIPFIADASAQSKNPPGAGVGSNVINLVDPDYKFPSLLRGNLSLDRDLFWGLVGTVEGLWTKNLQDVSYLNLNYQKTSTSPLDGRPRYSRKVTSLSDVILLSNTPDGYTWSMKGEVRRPFRNGWFFTGSYLYGEAWMREESQSSVAVTNWQNVFALDQDNRPMTRSDFSQGTRITFSASYDLPVYKGVSVAASVFYSGQSGRPYSMSYTGTDSNGDGVTFNDLFYLPPADAPLTYTNGTYANLLAFMEAEDCSAKQIGGIMERNSCLTPWINTLDAKFTFGLPLKRVKTEITVDVLNLINLIGDSNAGRYSYANFNQLAVFTPTVSATTGAVTNVNLNTINGASFSRYTRDDLRSRWQLQLGARLRF